MSLSYYIIVRVGEYILDQEQTSVVMDESECLLVSAGAGSGKTLTIVGKVKYLLEKGVKPDSILLITFTRNAKESMEEKIFKTLGVRVKSYTFHSLSINILQNNGYSYDICESDLLEKITHEFFECVILDSEYHMKLCLEYFRKTYTRKIKNDYIKCYRYNKKDFYNLERLIVTFIRLFKCGNYTLSDFNLFLKKVKNNIFRYKRDKKILILIINIYLSYEKYLQENNEIDFDDMIIKAISTVRNGTISTYEYIIIDEYQDTSVIRFELIKSIMEKNSSKLMVVGDDFQSIYRFTGCDVSLFTNFDKYFNKSRVLKLENTYRNSMELISVCGKFIMKNKRQIRKNLKSSKHLECPIEFIYYSDPRKEINGLLDRVLANYRDIMIIGRNNNDINKILNKDIIIGSECNIKYKSIYNLKYMTAHKSKGLESEAVILINLEDDILGFPSKIKDEKILRLVSKKENFKYAEERRLFYVALTRTKNKVYLFINRNNESCFSKELKRIIYK